MSAQLVTKVPPCYRCGNPDAQVPVRPHGLALCAAYYVENLRTTIGADQVA